MNSFELMNAALSGKKTSAIPVTPHWWGVYKYQLAGLFDSFAEEYRAWGLTPEQLAEVDEDFYRAFRPDMLHLGAGPSRIPYDPAREEVRQSLLAEVRKCESLRAVDDYAAFISCTSEDTLRSGTYDHVKIHAQRHGSDVFIAVNEGNPVCGLFDPGGELGGFEGGMIALAENPDYLAYLLEALNGQMLRRLAALPLCGAHGYIGSETCVSCDIISPDTYRSVIFPVQRRFYARLREMGLKTVVYFTGDVNPVIDDICRLGADGLMVEDSKKGFTLDVVDIARRINGRMALFGNLDSIYTLLMGTPADVQKETRRQLEAASYTPFIMACGSPLAFHTPAENIRAMMDTVREF